MSRVDKLRSSNSGDATGATTICEPTRNVQKNCNAAKKGEKKERQNKEKGKQKPNVWYGGELIRKWIFSFRWPKGTRISCVNKIVNGWISSIRRQQWAGER